MTSWQADPPDAGTSARPLRSRLVRSALLTVALPLLALVAAVAGIGLWLTARSEARIDAARAELTGNTVGQVKADQAQAALARIDTYLDTQIETVATWSRLPDVVAAAAAPYQDKQVAPLLVANKGSDQLDGGGAAANALKERQTATPGLVALVLTNASGQNVAATAPSDKFDHRNDDWWKAASTAGASVVRAGTDAGTGAKAFAVAVRVNNEGQGVGVLQAVFDLTALQAQATSSANTATGVSVSVVNAEGKLLADTATSHDPARILSNANFVDGRDPGFGQILTSAAESGYLSLGGTIAGYSRQTPTRRVAALGLDVQTPGWIAVVSQPADKALAASGRLSQLNDDTRRATWLAIGITAALALAGLALAWLLARRTARRVTASLVDLRDAAQRLADVDLPQLARGGPAGLRFMSPVVVDGDREVQEVAAALGSIQTGAQQLVADEAVDRSRELASVLVNLGRRNQQLIGRQLRFIDDLERSESNPDTLRNLFTLDQMATRMRRNAESLLVLAGEESPRRGTQPRPIDEVIRAATSEVEDFARVTIHLVDHALIQPRLVSDLTHLLAELIENATLFSPPESPVELSGQLEADGSYTITIVDHGLGLPSDRLHEANARIAAAAAAGGSPPSSFLGLFVVGRLAARHDIHAWLVDTPDTGVTAQVSLPQICLATGPEPAADIRGSRLHVSGPLPGGPLRNATPPPIPRRPRPGTPRPVGREQRFTPQPVAEEPERVPATGDGQDETTGLPIPPFRSRESRRGEPGVPATGVRHEVDDENRKFQVRRRVRKRPNDATVGSEAGADAGADAGLATGVARAEEVRSKLNQFTSGVEAAKAGRGRPGNTGGSADSEES